MAFDGITVAAVRKELDDSLTGGKIAKIIQPESDELLLTIKSRGETHRLLMSANASLPLIYSTDENRQAPDTAPNFCMLLRKHAGGGTKGNTLVNALLYHLDSLSGINGVLRPGIVHRIDKDTSGLLVVAKNDRAHVSLASQIEKKTCRREYIALLEGVVKEDKGHIETFIGRSDKDRKLMAVTKTGRKAATNFEVIKRYKEFTLCRFILETGRTHQIRVHAKYMGHPVVGDKAYGYKKQKFALEGQLLHAYKLTFTHPSTGETVSFTAPLPDYFERVLKSIAATEKQ